MADRIRVLVVACVLLLPGCASRIGQFPPATVMHRAEIAIRDARTRSNAAIAAHDTTAIAREWMPDLHVVSSTGAQNAGADANARAMQAQFDRRPDTKWVRESTRITIFDAWDVASEEGTWTGTWSDPDGPVRIAGTYLAQWRQVAGTWRIQAELFVPLTCVGGAYCTRRP